MIGVISTMALLATLCSTFITLVPQLDQVSYLTALKTFIAMLWSSILYEMCDVGAAARSRSASQEPQARFDYRQQELTIPRSTALHDGDYM